MPHVDDVLARAETARLNRRRFLELTAGLAGAAVFSQLRPDLGRSAAVHEYPFKLGVASGDPHPRGVTLWTRLIPDIYEPNGGMPSVRVPVRWRIATDERMRRVVRRGTTLAMPDLAHSVHVDVNGLEPGREYFYRFEYRGEASPVGHTRTAPRPLARVRSLAFAFASCQRWDEGFYSAYARMAEENIAFVVHLGDYLYENGINARGGIRNVPVPDQFRPECMTLDRYRIQYSLYKSDPDLKRAHRLFPWLVIWDDHEVENDYAAIYPEDGQANTDFVARRAAAYQAFYEHIPLRARSLPLDGSMRLYRRMRWGNLAAFNLLDSRQYRTNQPCGDGEYPRCAESLDPAVTMLGAEQERWLARGLASRASRWNVLANQVMMAQLDHNRGDPRIYWHDSWDGYPTARQRLVDFMALRPVRNPIVLTGDWHSTFVNDIKRDFSNPASETVASEFVGTSISSNNDRIVYGPYYGPMIPANPHIKFFEGDRRGYVRCRVNHTHWLTDLRMVPTVSHPAAPVYTLESFVVHDGRPGAEAV
jgi:alkaline phosphatase D